VQEGEERTRMDDTALTEQLTTRIDEALERYRGRDLVAASEITDLLLDLRLMLLSADEEARTATS
jgi:signal recognition particle GTPase